MHMDAWDRHWLDISRPFMCCIDYKSDVPVSHYVGKYRIACLNPQTSYQNTIIYSCSNSVPKKPFALAHQAWTSSMNTYNLQIKIVYIENRTTTPPLPKLITESIYRPCATLFLTNINHAFCANIFYPKRYLLRNYAQQTQSKHDNIAKLRRHYWCSFHYSASHILWF